MEDKFETKQQQENAIANFKNLLKQAGWQQLVEVVETNIGIIKEQILTGLDENNDKIPEEMMQRLRDKLQINREIISIPTKFVKDYRFNEHDEPDDDPFPTVESERKTIRRK